jgi:hypothetical protein
MPIADLHDNGEDGASRKTGRAQGGITLILGSVTAEET